MMRKNYRCMFVLVLTALFVFGAACAAISEASEEEVRIDIVVGFGAGGSHDLAARYMAEALREHGIIANVINMAGGMGTIAAAHVADQRPDANIFFWSSTMTLIFEPAVGDRGYTLDDFEAVGMLASPTFCLAARSGAPFETWEELLEYIEKNPGEVNIGGQGEGSVMHFYLTRMIDEEKYDYNYTAFAGGADVSLNLTGGHVDIGHLSLAAAGPLHAEGNLVVLVNTQSLQNRDPLMPEIRNITEMGIDAAEAYAVSLFARRGTDPELIQRIAKAMEKASKDENLIRNYKNSGMIAYYLPPEEAWKYYTDIVDEVVPLYQEWLKKF